LSFYKSFFLFELFQVLLERSFFFSLPFSPLLICLSLFTFFIKGSHFGKILLFL